MIWWANNFGATHRRVAINKLALRIRPVAMKKPAASIKRFALLRSAIFCSFCIAPTLVLAQSANIFAATKASPAMTSNASFDKAMELKALGDQQYQEYDTLRYDTSTAAYPWAAGYGVALEAANSYANRGNFYFTFKIPGRGKFEEEVERLRDGVVGRQAYLERIKQVETAAIAAHKASLALLEPLANTDPSNSAWQHALAIAYLDMAKVTFRDMSRTQSLVYSDKALAIQLRLVESQPTNTAWKLALANIYQRLGFAQKGIGWEDPFPGQTKRAEFDIRDKLQDADPKNPQWRHDLVSNNLRFAEMFWRYGHTTNQNGALLNAIDQLKVINVSDYSPQWQHEFALDYGRIGVMAAMVAGNGRKGAIRANEAFERALPLLRQQAEQNLGNLQWQREYASYLIESAKLQVWLEGSNQTTAIGQFTQVIDIRKAVLERDVTDARSQVDLIDAYKQFGDFHGNSSQGYPQAIALYSEAQRYLQMQSAKAPKDPAWLYYQLEVYKRIVFWQEDSLRARLGGYPDGLEAKGVAIRKEAQKVSDATFEKMLVIIKTLIDLHDQRLAKTP